MTLDEVIAENIRELREQAGLDRSELADRLGVGLHVARDYERPRKGQPQRSFTWQEIVRLCIALDTTIFRLVLPPPGVHVEDIYRTDPRELRAFAAHAIDEGIDGAENLAEKISRDSRSNLGLALFGIDGDKLKSAESFESFAIHKRKIIDDMTDRFSTVADEYLERFLQELEEGQE